MPLSHCVSMVIEQWVIVLAFILYNHGDMIMGYFMQPTMHIYQLRHISLLPDVNEIPLCLVYCKNLIASQLHLFYYCKTSNISHTLVGIKIVGHSDVVGASPVDAAPTTSSFPT